MRECKGAGMWAAVEARLHTAQHAAQLLVSLGGGGVAWRARARTERDKSVVFFSVSWFYYLCRLKQRVENGSAEPRNIFTLHLRGS